MIVSPLCPVAVGTGRLAWRPWGPSTTVVGNFAADHDVGRVSALRRFASPVALLSVPDEWAGPETLPDNPWQLLQHDGAR